MDPLAEVTCYSAALTAIGHAKYRHRLYRVGRDKARLSKFYHLSPYAYCAGDPVNLVDPDGRKIYFADGVPEWFKERFAATIQYMNEKGTSWIFKKLQDSDNTYKINYIDDDNIMYDPEKK